MNLVIGQNATTTTVAASANSAVFGQTVTLTATVARTSPGAGTPTGIVMFMDGTTVLGTGTLATAGGVTTATFPASTLAVGTHAITAVYGGDTNNLTSTSTSTMGPVSLVINHDATTTTVALPANSAVFGQTLSLTATVAVTAPGAGTPTGVVMFMDSATILGPATLSTANGVTTATLKITALMLGTNQITALYGGDTNDLASTSAPVSLVVKNATTTMVTTSVNSPVFGQAVTLTASTYVPGSGISNPTGTFTFMDGTTVLGTVPVSIARGISSANFTTSALATATHAITAVYSGDSNNLTSTSAPLSLVVNQDATTTTVAASANPVAFGQAVTLTATVAVTSPGVGTPTGMVTFMDGTTVLGSGTLRTANGVTTATFQTPLTLAVATHVITAVYGGDTNDLTSISAPLSLVVAKLSNIIS